MYKQTERFIKGALVLSVAGLLAKVFSAFYRIPLTRMIGIDGLGYYDTVYPLYAILVATSLVGVPNSVSKMVAEHLALGHYKRAHKVFVDALVIVVGIGVLITALMILGADWLISIQGWTEDYRYALYGFAIAPVFISITGAIRGYFQGMQLMMPTAVSQVMEAAGKVVIGLLFVSLLLTRGYDMPIVVMGATVGASLGFVMTTVYMVFVYLWHRPMLKSQMALDLSEDKKIIYGDLVKGILMLTLPVTIVSATYSIMNEIDSAMLYRVFENLGYSADYVRLIFGQKTMAFTIVNVPLTISLAIAMSVVPAIAQANSLENHGEKNYKINEAIKLSFLFALPSAAGIYVLAEPILYMLYPTAEADPVFLQLYAICLVFMILGQCLAAILQGMTKHYWPLLSLLIAVVVKVILNGYLAKYFTQGYGAPLSSIAYYGIFVFINFLMVKRTTTIRLDWIQILFKPLLATVIMGVVAALTYYLEQQVLSSRGIGVMLAVALGGITYFGVLLITKTLSEEDLAAIPGGKKLSRRLKKQ